MKPGRVAAFGLLLLAPALLVFSTRHALVLAAAPIPPWLRVMTGVGGALSALGFLLLVASAIRTGPRPAPVIAGVATAFLGHYVVTPFVGADPGGALVYAGTAFVIASFAQSKPLGIAALVAGAAAAAAALLRGPFPVPGLALNVLANLVLAALATAIALRFFAPAPAHATRARSKP